MKKFATVGIERFFLIVLAATIVFGGCGKNRGGAITPIKTPFPPTPVDHSFTNGQRSQGDLPSTFSASGPVVSDVVFSPDSLSIQGQTLTLSVAFADPDMDLSAPSLLVQVIDQPEYWVIGSSQFGGIVGNTAVVLLDVSTNFEPDAHLVSIALMDDAGNVGNVYTSALIVERYFTPQVSSLTPANGSIDAPLNTAVRAVFTGPVINEPVSLTLATSGGQAVPGSERVLPDLEGAVFVPDSFLLPDTSYRATVTMGNPGAERVFSSDFTTGPLNPAPDVTGRVYSVFILPDNIVEPAGAEVIFQALVIPPILTKIKVFDNAGGIISGVGALGGGSPLSQSPLFPIMVFPDSGAVLFNPYFSLGPSALDIDLYALTGGIVDASINIYDFYLSGRFSPTGDLVENVAISGYLLASEINYVVNLVQPPSMPFDACIQLPGACDSSGRIVMRVEDISGPYEPQIVDLYDLSVDVAPNTVAASSGGAITVSGETTVNGDPSGVNSVDLSASNGVFPGGGSIETATTSGGTYSTTLTVPAGLTPGSIIDVTATYNSPIGAMNRSAKVVVQ